VALELKQHINIDKKRAYMKTLKKQINVWCSASDMLLPPSVCLVIGS